MSRRRPGRTRQPPRRDAAESLRTYAVDAGSSSPPPEKSPQPDFLGPTDLDLEELTDVWAALEGLAAERAAAAARRRGVPQLESALDYMKQSLTDDYGYSLADAHRAFHRAVHRLAGNRTLARLLASLEGRVPRQPSIAGRPPGDAPAIVNAHLALLNLLRIGPPPEVRREFEAHAREGNARQSAPRKGADLREWEDDNVI